MVELSATDLGHDATRVELPVAVGVNGNRDGLLGDGPGKGGLRVGHIGEGDSNSAIDGGAAGVAGGNLSLSRDIRVVVLRAEASSLDVAEGIVHEATAAAHVSTLSVAADKLLLGEGDLLLILKVVSSLHSTGGGEGPAASALSLVLDSSDHVGGGPVDGIIGLDTLEVVDEAAALLARSRLTEVDGRELLESKVGELVVAKSEGAVASVVLLDDIAVGLESRESLLEVSVTLKGQGVLGNVSSELSSILGMGVNVLGVDGSDNGSGSGESELHLDDWSNCEGMSRLQYSGEGGETLLE